MKGIQGTHARLMLKKSKLTRVLLKRRLLTSPYHVLSVVLHIFNHSNTRTLYLVIIFYLFIGMESQETAKDMCIGRAIT